MDGHLRGAYVFLTDGQVEGFYLPSFGDGLITATTPKAGTELMKIRLGIMDNATFPIDNRAAAEFMHNKNFLEYRTAKRMRLGKQRAWEPANIYNRVGGNLG